MIKLSRICSLLVLAACFGTANPLYATQTPYPTPTPMGKDNIALTAQKDPFLSAYLKLAENGDFRAQTALGTLYLQRSSDNYNPKIAFKWFLRAAEGGHKLAQFNLGTLYQQGLGTRRNGRKALNWLLKVADYEGSDSSLTPEMLAWARLKVGIIFHKGKGVPVNYPEALKWFSKLTTDKHAYGQYMTGMMYANGQGVPKNLQKALKLFRAAASQGLESAQTELDATRSKLQQNENGVMQVDNDNGAIRVHNDAGVIHIDRDTGTIQVNNDTELIQANNDTGMIRVNNDAGMIRVERILTSPKSI
jgi:TPR repeat protein